MRFICTSLVYPEIFKKCPSAILPCPGTLTLSLSTKVTLQHYHKHDMSPWSRTLPFCPQNFTSSTYWAQDLWSSHAHSMCLSVTELNSRQLLCFKAVKLCTPSYLNNMLKPYAPLRALRSSNMDLLTVPRTDTSLGLRRYSVAGPQV